MAEKSEARTHKLLFWKWELCLLAFLMLIIVLVFNGTAFGHDRTVTFRTSAPGESKAIVNWGLDTAWYDGNNVRRGAVFMGPERVDVVRISFTPTAALVNGNLQAAELNRLNQRLNWVDLWTNPNTTVCINEDSPTVDASFIGSNGYISPTAWAELIDVTAAHAQARGRTVVSVAPFNEPDLFRSERLANMQTFYNTAGVLLGKPRFSTIRISGGNTLNTDQANPWYNYLKARLDEGCTHQLAGNFNNYASFFQNVVASGHHATNDELHNVMEAMVGAEYGMQTGIWWYTAERARGEFVKASDGQRLGYAEHRPNWTAASVYRAPDGNMQAFVGESERQALPTTYRFVSLDRNVFYDGYGPQREYTLKTTGGPGYQTAAHRNAERVVNITWGNDIQPVIDGRYVVVNRKSRKVMEVAGGAAGNGANIQQNTYNSGTYQQWDINPLSYDTGGDYSYHTIKAVHSQKAADVYNFSLNDSGDIRQWEYSTSINQQWYFEYIEDGWFHIRSRWSGKYLNVSGGSSSNGANIQQYSLYPSDPERQQWRLIPIGANPADFTAPATPTGVTASANPVSVQLTWNANTESDLAGYTVLRSTTDGGPYEMIARNIATASFTDNSAIRSIPHYYVVRAVDKSLNRSADSAQVSATPTGIATLVAQYDFNGNEQDASINANNGVINGSVGYGTGIVGSNSLVLDGNSGHVSLPAKVADLDEMTIAAWVNWSGGGNWQRIFDFGNDTDQYLFLTPRSGNGTLRFTIKNGGGEQITETAGLPTGTWVHVAVTLSGNTAILYVNGSAAASNNAMTIKPSDFSPVCNYIGKSQWSDPLFNGQIDDFRIYNYALSAAQVAGIPHETPEPSPWEGIIRPIPGAIQAEHFDLGGPGVAYSDTTLGNSGGQYRPYDSVDIFSITDGLSAYAIGNIETGEWLLYSVNSSEAQTDVYVRVASVSAGGQILIWLDDDLLATVEVPNTGSLTAWQTVSAPCLPLPEREDAKLKIAFVGSGFRLNWFSFGSQMPYWGAPSAIPGRVEFEDFDTGGQYISYYDKTPTNAYNRYRLDEEVDIMMVNDGGLEHVVYAESGEWLEYTCDIEAGSYTVIVRTGSVRTEQQLTLSIDGQTLATFTLPPTGNWSTFQNTAVSGVYLPGGERVIRFTQSASDSNLNWVEFVRQYNIADITRSGQVDLGDFSALAAQWLGVPGVPSADIAPIGGDGAVDILDLLILIENWLIVE